MITFSSKNCSLIALLLLISPAGIDASRISKAPEIKWSPKPAAQAQLNNQLISASYDGNLPEVKSLLAKKANVNATTDTGATPLYYAAQQGHAKIVQFLLDAKANVNAPLNDGTTALIATTTPHDTESSPAIIDTLIAAGADVNAHTNAGMTAFLGAATFDLEDQPNPDVRRKLLMTDKLIKAGANINAQDDRQHTALHYLVLNDESLGLELFKLILKHNPDLNLRDYEGHTVLHHLAMVPNNLQELELVVQRAPNIIDIRANDGNTSLMIAADDGHTEVAQLLLAAGADITIVNNNNETALALAQNEHHQEIVDKLESITNFFANPATTIVVLKQLPFDEQKEQIEMFLAQAISRNRGDLVDMLIAAARPDLKDGLEQHAYELAKRMGRPAIENKMVSLRKMGVSKIKKVR
jgi:ankyrin repeat protein